MNLDENYMFEKYHEALVFSLLDLFNSVDDILMIMKKKLKLAVIILAFLSCYLEMKAQNEIQEQNIGGKATWGIKLETNMSNFFISGTSVLDSGMRPGFSGGAFLNVELSGNFSLQGELMYHYKTSVFNRENIKGRFLYWGMDLPVYAMYQIKMAKESRFYTGIGLYGDFGFSSKLKRGTKTIDLYEKGQISEISAMKDTNVGLGVIIGYEFTSGLQINAGYKIGIKNILDSNSNTISLRPSTVSLGIGYRFK